MDGDEESNSLENDDVRPLSASGEHQAQLQELLELTGKRDTSKESKEGGSNVESHLCSQLSALFSSPEKLTAIFRHDSDLFQGSAQDDGSASASGINFKAVRALYQNIRAMVQEEEHSQGQGGMCGCGPRWLLRAPDVETISKSVLKASGRLLEENKISRAGQSRNADAAISDKSKQLVSCFLIIFANPLLLEPENHPLLQTLARSLNHLGAAERSWAVQTLSRLPKEDLEEMVAVVQQCITVQLYEAGRISEAVQICTKLLKLLYDANAKSGVLPLSSFYNDAVNNNDLVDPDKEYYHWRKPQRYAFSFCNYPFILDLGTKCRILQLDSHIEMQQQFERAFIHGLINQGGFIEPFNVMRVRRDNLIHDAMTHVQRRKEDLKKQLRVQFIGEDGLDEGGVRKEFFQLVVMELFDPKYGMFSYNEQRRQFWFSLQTGELLQIQEDQDRLHALQIQQQAEGRGKVSSSASKGDQVMESSVLYAGQGDALGTDRLTQGSRELPGNASPDPLGFRPQGVSSSRSQAEDLELRREYELVGMLLGLAIYNSCILEVRFPRVVYKKLLGRRLGLDDLHSLDEDLAKGLKDLLNFQGDVEEAFGLTFQVTAEDIFGDKHVIDLVPGGGQIPLTSENRQEYVDACVKFYLDISIHRQFSAFAKGFKHLVPEHVLKLFEPEELELLICGISELDFVDLEKGAHYTDGYTKGHKSIQQFWEIAHGLSKKDKKNLLMFVTGCDRSPVRGLGSLKFTISRNGPDSDRLPTAHTCFNHLLLPEYKSKDKLRDRLLTAINNAKGFGLQ